MTRICRLGMDVMICVRLRLDVRVWTRVERWGCIVSVAVLCRVLVIMLRM